MNSKLKTQGTGLWLAVLALCLMMSGFTMQLVAQASGSIVGTVTDASGAVISDASVALTNLGTNEKKTVETDAAGNYRFLSLIPAQYKLEIEKANYKKMVKSPVTVQVGSATRMDAALEVGAASETVEVTSAAPLLQTESGTLGSQVEGKTVQEMPLNGRNTMNLIALVPGVVPQGASQGTTSMNQSGHSSDSGWGNYQIGGSVSGQGVIMVDGTPVNALGANVVGFIPVQDAIQEFKVSTSATSAEFGRFGGGVVEMSTKSGSNQFHASAYEYLRNTVLNANTYSWNLQHPTDGKRSKYNQNQYGVFGSGPVWKDKAFFMFSLEKFSSRIASTTSTNIPDDGMMSATDPSVKGTIKDPSAIAWASDNLWNCSASWITQYNVSDGRTHINPVCLDSAAQLFKTYYPSTSSPYYSTTSSNGFNYNTSTGIGNDNYQYNIRGDINLSANQRLFARFTKMNMTDIPDNPMHSANGHNTGNASSKFNTMQGVIGDTITVNQNTVADVHISYLRKYSDNLQGSAGSADAKSFLSSLGSGWAPLATAASVAQLPKLEFDNFGGGPLNLYNFRAMFLYGQNWYDNYTLSSSITKIIGSHTLKAGGEIRFLDESIGGAMNPSGTLNTFSSNYTGNEWANFLLGMSHDVEIGIGQKGANFNWYQGYYLTDTWAVNRKLTVTAGVRWELPGAVSERKDRGTVLLPDQINYNSLTGTTVRGSLALVNSAEWRDRSTMPGLHNLLSPRFGLAYRLNSNTVLRAGYALTYVAPDLSAVNNSGSVLPTSSAIMSADTDPQNSGSAVYYTAADPYGNRTAAVNAGKKQVVNTPYGRSWGSNFVTMAQKTFANGKIAGPVPTTSYPYMQQWNFGIGQQFRGQQSLEVGYAGALAVHLLPAGGNWNLDQPNATQFAGIAANASTMTNAQLRAAYTPFPNYTNVVNGSAYVGTVNYNSLQVRYEKRFNGGGMISSGYTMSKSLGNADSTATSLDSGADGVPQDYTNPAGDHSLLSFSMRGRWITSYVMPLPFGKGQKYLNNLNGLLDRVIGGWALNGITSIQSGQPLMITSTSNQTGNWNAGSLRPNVTAGCDKMSGISGSQQSRMSKWFNTSCFTAPGAYSFGNESRVDSKLVGSGMANWDITALKSTKVTEKTSIQFRAEFFNIFNRRQWSLPGMQFGNSQFGKISSQQNAPRQMQASLRFSF